MTRRFWVLMHRYFGLTMTVFLIIVGLTGSILAFREQIDLWMNPDLLRVEVRDAPMLDPLVLREKAEALDPRYRIDQASLSVEPGRSYEAFRSLPVNKAAQAQEIVPMVGHVFFHYTDPTRPRMVYLDPYTGEKIGERLWGEISLQRKDFISFIYRLHMTLGLPEGFIGLGERILGVTALLWTLDCFVGFYLTLPKLKKRDFGNNFTNLPNIVSATRQRSWWQRWQPAWKIKFGAGATRINFDIHRAFGLWTWVMLFIFAWSSVYFNLEEVYNPVMNTLFGAPPPEPVTPNQATKLDNPKLGWVEARAKGKVLLEEKAHIEGFIIKREISLSIDRNSVRYSLCADIIMKAEDKQTCVELDANTGLAPETQQTASETDEAEPISLIILYWITSLHMAAVFGLPMKIFICLMGFVITALSVTGVVIWWKKRQASKSKPRKVLTETRITIQP